MSGVGEEKNHLQIQKPLIVQQTKNGGTFNVESQQKSDTPQNIPAVPFTQLLRFATRQDYVMMIIGGIASMINGLAVPMFALIFGQMADSFSPTSTGDEIVDSARQQALYFIYVGIGSFFLSWIQMWTWMVTGERQAIEFRKEYFKAVMRQEVGWFDLVNPNELSGKIATETFQIQGAIGEKVPTFFMTIFMMFGGFGVGFLRGWQMALVSSAALPLVVLGATAFAFVLQNSEKKISGSYLQAGGIAEQSLNSVKTIKSLAGEDYVVDIYKTKLFESFKTACRFGYYAGAGIGLTFMAMFFDYSLSFWYGSRLVGDQTMNSTLGKVYTSGDVLVVFFAIMIGGFSLGQSGPCIKSFAIGRQAGKKIFDVIDREPLIKVPENAEKIDNLQGNIIFRNVHFEYPAKPDLKVLKGMNLTIRPNEKTALVGESGCGKSTIMQLILRFYDAKSGEITIDGKNILKLDFKWLRKNVGYVGQEPILFAATIRENLRFGKEDANEQEMIEALKQANAWEFVQELDNGLDTYVGHSGSQISGGQKQRICIARAILKNPQILLLDEATSALDRQNEAAIQKTLDEISKGRTTIVVAHRLTTIQNADRIIVIEQGQIVEEGQYKQLMNTPGKFQALSKNQDIQKKNDLKEAEFEDQTDGTIDKFQHANSINESQSIELIQINRKGSLLGQAPSQIVEANSPQSAEDEKQAAAQQSLNLRRLMKLNEPERKFFFFGAFFSILNGLAFPSIGFILGSFIDIMSSPESPTFREDADMLSLYFLLIAVCSFLLNFSTLGLFTRIGESLTARIREMLLKKLMKMPSGWFDLPQNSPGNLSACLAVDAQMINALTSNIISIQIQSVSSLVMGLGIALIYSWQLSLVALGVCPLMIIAGQVQAKFVQGFSEQTDGVYKESNALVMESVTNIRSVTSFSNEKQIEILYASKLKGPYELIFNKGSISGLIFGFSQFSLFFVYAVIFYCGALFVRDSGLGFKDLFVSINAILYAAFGAGSTNSFMRDVGSAKSACKKIFEILDSEDELQIAERQVTNKITTSMSSTTTGNIEFRNVTFKYPSRDVEVLKNLSFKITTGQKVAFVGPSGSGKSSILQLLLRFYEDYEGEILVNGENIKNYNLHDYRSIYGVVSQEPVLFNDTIEGNIRFNKTDATVYEIQEAARQANALNFIENNEFESADQPGVNSENFGKGFQRQVGPKGSQISGGQKQRIAIARAVIRNPRILLLDEATSALDNQNERIVQEALDQVMKGKTSLSVAHRVSTIKNSDCIFVIENGKLIEEGNYEKLMANKSHFFNLNAQ